jgi:integrase
MANIPQLWFEAYCSERPGELRQSSRKVYGSWWSRYCAFLTTCGVELPAASADLAARFLHQYAPNTAIRYYRLLSAVYNTAIERGSCQTNPLAALQAEFDREELTVPAPAPGATAVAALYAIRPSGSWKKHRDHMLVLLAAESGLRSHELLTLTQQQLHLASIPPYLVVQRPGHTHQVELPIAAAEQLRAWIAMRSKVGVQGDLVFPTDLAGAPLHPSTAYRIIAKQLDQVGAGKAALGASGAQVLRSGFAYRSKAQGLAVTDIQEQLGHRQTLSTVEFLARVAPADK